MVRRQLECVTSFLFTHSRCNRALKRDHLLVPNDHRLGKRFNPRQTPNRRGLGPVRFAAKVPCSAHPTESAHVPVAELTHPARHPEALQKSWQIKDPVPLPLPRQFMESTCVPFAGVGNSSRPDHVQPDVVNTARKMWTVLHQRGG